MRFQTRVRKGRQAPGLRDRNAKLEVSQRVQISLWYVLRPPKYPISNQGEKSINMYFIRVPLRKKVLKYGTPKPREVYWPRRSRSAVEESRHIGPEDLKSVCCSNRRFRGARAIEPYRRKT